ncbi:unnamed protein product [Brassicogethes aeneus]|uniref:Nucleoside diphosphate kinase 7 n=1 Tax=Brassicogethes aeneus TaxID=1431903 RepID=A0A9P0B087_BRAAE|nr:unnamed protein product [Brassicogethes aeneus]
MNTFWIYFYKMWPCNDAREMDLKPEDYDFNDKLSFQTIWLDYDSSCEKKFILNYFPCDNTMELIDLQVNRVFLRRTNLPAVRINDMFIGNEIRVYGRQIKIADYADRRTARFVGKYNEHTLALIKPGGMDQMADTLKIIEENDFKITKLKVCQLTRHEAKLFYDYSQEESYAPSLIEHIISGPVVAMEIVGENAVKRWNKLIGQTSSYEARRTSNDLHGSLNEELAVREAKFFFANHRSTTALRQKNTTCCVIKPHAVKDGNIGRIVKLIANENFAITAMQMFNLNKPNADEFLEVYKGVISDYNALVLSFLDGPCLALEVASKSGDCDVHGQFRKFCGPYDTEIAKQIRPNSLRAKFGVDKYKNAVHCTDLPDDTGIELEYFFKILNDYLNKLKAAKMKYCLVVVLFTICSGFPQKPIKLGNEEDREMRNQIALDCIDKIGIEKEMILKAVATRTFPEDRKYKDFLACSYKKQGFQQEDGTLSIENLKIFMERFYKREELSVMEPCALITGPTHGDIARSAAICLIESIEPLEAINDL